MDPERAESVAAVRSVLADVLDRDGGWAELAEAGLLGLAVPEAYGGEGLGLAEVACCSARPPPARCTSRSGRRSAAAR